MTTLAEASSIDGRDALPYGDAQGCAFLDTRLVVTEVSPDFAAPLGVAPHTAVGRAFTIFLSSRSGALFRRGCGELLTCTDGFTEHVDVVRGDRRRQRAQVCVYALCGAFLVTLSLSPMPQVTSFLLTELDARILEGLAYGESTASIAGRVFLSREAVSYHLTALLRAFGVANRTSLISKAYCAGVLDTANWPPRVCPRFVK